MSLSIEDIKKSLPHYLTLPQQQGLVRALSEFPNCNLYCSRDHSGFLQGDGWSKLEIVNFQTSERRAIKGMILSNSCDIDPSNKRPISGNIVFAPLMGLDQYCEIYRNVAGADRLSGHVGEIRKQKLTSIFYLPVGGGLDKEHIVRFDDVHTVPISCFSDRSDKAKSFTLSQVGFYVFLMKLSIHFCRVHEGEVRD